MALPHYYCDKGVCSRGKTIFTAGRSVASGSVECWQTRTSLASCQFGGSRSGPAASFRRLSLLRQVSTVPTPCSTLCNLTSLDRLLLPVRHNLLLFRLGYEGDMIFGRPKTQTGGRANELEHRAAYLADFSHIDNSER